MTTDSPDKTSSVLTVNAEITLREPTESLRESYRAGKTERPREKAALAKTDKNRPCFTDLLKLQDVLFKHVCNV